MSKLHWTYVGDHYRAEYEGLRIRAVRDESPENPFEQTDCNWPVVIRLPDRSRDMFTDYDRAGGVANTSPHGLRNPLGWFTDALVVHWQVHIAKILDVSLRDELGCAYSRDALELRAAFDGATDGIHDSKLLEVYAELYKLLGFPVLVGTSNGYSQGDTVEVLVIATPGACKAFGCDPPKPEDLQPTIDLYGAWCWGDVYGYVVERVEEVATCGNCGNTDNDGSDECPDCGCDMEDEETVTEIDSCWGFYGSDLAKSGLEEAAIAACGVVLEKVDG